MEEVSIPLGTINTLDRLHDQLQPHIVSIPLGTINTNNGTGAGTNPFYVSIPLGTINTVDDIKASQEEKLFQFH